MCSAQYNRLDVWNHERFVAKLHRDPYTDDDARALVGIRDLRLMTEPLHEPVMVAETVDLLAPSRGGLFVDCTVGLGGHTRALLEAGASRVLGLDRDPEALRDRARASRRIR